MAHGRGKAHCMVEDKQGTHLFVDHIQIKKLQTPFSIKKCDPFFPLGRPNVMKQITYLP